MFDFQWVSMPGLKWIHALCPGSERETLCETLGLWHPYERLRDGKRRTCRDCQWIARRVKENQAEETQAEEATTDALPFDKDEDDRILQAQGIDTSPQGWAEYAARQG